MTASTTDVPTLSLFKRIRILLAIYFAFVIIDFIIPFSFYRDFWYSLIIFTGEHILGLSNPITIRPNGSGDTTYNYVQQLLWIVLSILIATLWAILDRKRPSYRQFQYWSRVVVRYYLAYVLFIYGFVKIIKLQFPEPSLYRLLTTYGDSSPMGLAWTFIGYSSGYNLFIGAAEVLAGALLFFKRTTLMGALLTVAVMSNVFVMNMSFDIPVKLFSMTLILMGAWLASYDSERLIGFFLLNKVVNPAPLKYPFQTKWKKIVQISLKSLVIVYALYATLYSDYKMSKQYGDTVAKPPLYGIYNVETFKLNGKELPPLTTDSARWKRMVFNHPEKVGIYKMTDKLERMNIFVDTITKNISFRHKAEEAQFKMSYDDRTKGSLILKGKIGKDTAEIVFKKVPLESLRLYKTSFRWINEFPNNR